MKRWVLPVLSGAAAAGLGIAIVEMGRCLHMLAVPGSTAASTVSAIQAHIALPSILIIGGLIAAGYGLAVGMSSGRPLSYLLSCSVSVALGVAVSHSVLAIARPFLMAPMPYLPAFTLSAVTFAGLYLYLTTATPLRSWRNLVLQSCAFGAITSVAAIIAQTAAGECGTLTFGGFGIFRTLSQPAELREFPSLLQDTTSALLCGGIAGFLVARIRRMERRSLAAAGSALAFGWLSVCLYAAHQVLATVILRSGFSEAAASRTALLVHPTGAVAAALGVAIVVGAFPSRRVAAMLTCALLFSLGASAWYVAGSRAGGDLYRAAVSVDPYRTRVYVHFRTDGSWTRSLERNGDDIVTSYCGSLVTDYPRSIYVPDALYLKARAQFTSWRFDDASQTLRTLRNWFPDANGAATQLLVYSYLAGGRYADVATDLGRDEHSYALWRGTVGAQVVGRAYELIGRPNSARGLYAYYLQSLDGNAGVAWLQPAVRYAESRYDRVSEPPVHFGVVRGRIVGPEGPLCNIHVALVQPHIDAASPDDSQQFNSAFTVPVWFGRTATTGRDGCFSIPRVGYGHYEVVIGFDATAIPSGTVVSGAVPAIEVDRPEVRMGNVRLVRAVRQVSPVGGDRVGGRPTLCWEALPEAAYYSVSIVAASETSSGSERATGPSTCWTRSHIVGGFTSIQRHYFVSSTEECRAGALLPGKDYMWIVFAYDRAGRMISSSEHYRLDQEPEFRSESDQSKGDDQAHHLTLNQSVMYNRKRQGGYPK